MKKFFDTSSEYNYVNMIIIPFIGILILSILEMFVGYNNHSDDILTFLAVGFTWFAIFYYPPKFIFLLLTYKWPKSYLWLLCPTIAWIILNGFMDWTLFDL